MVLTGTSWFLCLSALLLSVQVHHSLSYTLSSWKQGHDQQLQGKVLAVGHASKEQCLSPGSPSRPSPRVPVTERTCSHWCGARVPADCLVLGPVPPPGRGGAVMGLIRAQGMGVQGQGEDIRVPLLEERTQQILLESAFHVVHVG